jgi:hypothetical protein
VIDYLAELAQNRAEGPEFAATAKAPKPKKLTASKKRGKLNVKRSQARLRGKKEGGPKHPKTSRKSPMAKKFKPKKSGRLSKQEIKHAGGVKQAWAARKSAHGGKTSAAKKTTKKGKGKKKSAKKASAKKTAKKGGKKSSKKKGGKKGKASHRKGGKSGSRSSSRTSHRTNTRIVKQTIVKHVPSGGLLVQAPKKRRAKKKGGKKGKGRKSTKGKKKGGKKGKSKGRKGAAMENPMTGVELFVGSVTGLGGFLIADAVDRLLATHALTDKGTKDANGNELYADSPPTTGDYAGLFNATAICAPMDAKRWIVGLLLAGAPLTLAHFVSAPTGRAALQFFGFAAGVRIVGKGLTDLVALAARNTQMGQQLYDGEMRASVLKANSGNQAATELGSLPSAGLGRTMTQGVGKADCAPCADKAAGTGYPSNVREAPAANAGATAPTPGGQMAPPPPPPPPPPPATIQNVSTLTGPRNGVAGAPKRNRFNWGHTEN